jgi:hypothetical protein
MSFKFNGLKKDLCKYCQNSPEVFFRWMKPIAKNEYEIIEYFGVCSECLRRYAPLYHREDTWPGEIKLISISRDEFEVNQLMES